MRVLVAPDRFAGTLTAVEATQAIVSGWRRHAAADTLDACPLSGGGPGFLDTLLVSVDGRSIPVPVTGPLGAPATAEVLLAPDAGGGPTAYVESAQACGLRLVPPDRRDPRVTTSAGLATVLLAARDSGARRIVVGLGGSATNDAGAGLLAALLREDRRPGDRRPGDRLGELLGHGGGGLDGVRAPDLASLVAVRERWAGVEIVIASDADCPLLGFHGTSAGYAVGKGATPGQAQDLERSLGAFAAAAVAAFGLPRSVIAESGAGAGGGLGFALTLLGGHRVPGPAAVLDAVGFTSRLRGADLVVTGEGSLDGRSPRGTVVAAVAAAALELGTPVIAVAGQVLLGRGQTRSMGISSAYPVAVTPGEVELALADPAGTLAARAERVARTWSR